MTQVQAMSPGSLPRAGLAALALAAAPAGALEVLPMPGAEMSVPSGQPVTLEEVLLDEAPGAPWLRLRFLAPGIAPAGGAVDPEAAALDMDHLCREVAVPYVLHHGLAPERVVVSLADRILPFGVSDPETTQFFELYRIEDAACIWEAF